jgi:SAM-dependent methyltransferase
VDIVNTEQAAAWDGHEGDLWTEHADRYERAARRITKRFLEAGLIGESDHVLDIGCGTGALTRAVGRVASSGDVTGIDLSSRMLEFARARSKDEALASIAFVQGDAQVYPFPTDAFDVAISSFGTMFFNDPIAAYTNIGTAVRSGGRLALLVWRTLPENDWLMSLRGALAVGRELPMPPPDAPTPFSHADPDRVRGILDAAGFDDVELRPIDELMELGTDVADALEFARTMGIVEGLSDGLSPEKRAEAMSNIADLFRERETAEGVLLPSAAWLITASKR